MREFRITEARVKEIANVPDWLGSMALMKKWFPEAFEPEWEEVPFGSLIPVEAQDENALILRTTDYDYPVAMGVRKPYKDYYKIEKGKIYRRREL